MGQFMMAERIRQISEKEYRFLLEKLTLFERFFDVVETQEKTYKKVIEQLISDRYLSETTFQMGEDLKRQSNWIDLLESVVPKDVKKKLLDRHKHIFHLPINKYPIDDMEELIQ